MFRMQKSIRGQDRLNLFGVLNTRQRPDVRNDGDYQNIQSDVKVIGWRRIEYSVE